MTVFRKRSRTPQRYENVKQKLHRHHREIFCTHTQTSPIIHIFLLSLSRPNQPFIPPLLPPKWARNAQIHPKTS